MNWIEKELDVRGFNPRLRGTSYMAAAVERVCESRERYLYLTKTLYPDIAKKGDTSWKNVERCMRYAVRASGCSEPVGRVVYEVAMRRPNED